MRLKIGTDCLHYLVPIQTKPIGTAEGVINLIGVLPEDNPLSARHSRQSSSRMLADEPLHAFDRVAGVGCVRLAGHEAVIGAAIQFRLDLASGLLPALDEPLHRLDRD